MQTIDTSYLPPIHHTLGGHDIEWNPSTHSLSIKYTASEAFTNPRGHIQGGMICAMLDDAMGIFAMLANDGKAATTINLTMDFLRPCNVGEVTVQCQFLKHGHKILNIDALALQNHKIVARSTANFMVL